MDNGSLNCVSGTVRTANNEYVLTYDDRGRLRSTCLPRVPDLMHRVAGITGIQKSSRPSCARCPLG
jgi:hypothetical protein